MILSDGDVVFQPKKVERSGIYKAVRGHVLIHIDYFNRTGASRSNMFDNRPNETQYFYTDYDGSGAELNGSGIYEITFPAGQEPPVNGFWSLTLYNDKHLFHPSELKRYSLSTKNKNLKRNADGSLKLYAGAKSPGAEKEAMWLPAPNGHFLSLHSRLLGQRGHPRRLVEATGHSKSMTPGSECCSRGCAS